MKKVFKNSILPALFCALSVVVIGSGCHDQLEDDAPVITVQAPNDDDIFYVEFSLDVQDYLVMRATAKDDSKIVRGTVTVFNSDGGQEHYYEQLSNQLSRPSITQVNTVFRTSIDDTYTVVFEFEDSHGNTSTVTRSVTCEATVEDTNDNVPS